MNKALKAIVAAAVPTVVALMMWLATGTLDQAELSVGLTGLLTALLVYLAPNTSQSRQDVAPDRSRKDDLYRK